MLVGALIPIVAILIGGLVLLVPIAGLTLRFALKPALEAYAQARKSSGDREEIRILQQRLALVEEQLHALTTARLLEEGRGRERGGSQLEGLSVHRAISAPVHPQGPDMDR